MIKEIVAFGLCCWFSGVLCTVTLITWACAQTDRRDFRGYEGK